jgi:hypothetical protein
MGDDYSMFDRIDLSIMDLFHSAIYMMTRGAKIKIQIVHKKANERSNS